MKNKQQAIAVGVVLFVVVAVFYLGIVRLPRPNANLPRAAALPPAGSPEVQYVTLKEGGGPAALIGDTLTVHYIGTLQDGTVFDSSRTRGAPFVFVLGREGLIRGWHESFRGMKVGERRRVTIPPELAYGEEGRPPVIPPNASLIFDIELLEVKKP
ncbi:MAG: FKBP-type peptidyl-prolyl cis-trans isomerase [Candidatus Taylorbacteria bacterium]|nr:FKBP-type peptidyl-prolyl cis-trans isomerase [Candidatus Taylorbacteria bacterium]